MKILVLGAGRMGFGAAFDLIHNSGVESVTIADVELDRAKAIAERVGGSKLVAKQADASDYGQSVELMRGHDAAISCVTYPLNLQLARAAVEAKVNFCDLGGNNDVVAAELALDQSAREAGINIIPDCGLAPGMVSVLVAHGSERFDKLDEVHMRVGGLPLDPRPPFDYQIVFSVEGLINEYVERARVVRDGKIVEVDSMTEFELLDFPPFGILEAFQTSGGTSTLPETFLGSIKELDYKTIRYPGHGEKFKALIEAGMMSGQEITVDGARVRPRRVLAEMLTRLLPSDGPDAVLVRVEFRGALAGRRQQLRYDIVDRYDEATGLSAMMRTTAFPASIIAQMMARGETTEKGAIPQERCVPPGPFVEALAARNINIVETSTEI
ncbi:MAG TPA: saccharopine dehydrogenase C-terminal domain-containing protein [Blastocatellia bacterium]|jgi:lysine 6-dehydrogenase|nr:saccharopine dehydrogenase C-terminal domain-containing protein [Blastocatellia bacterium]